MRFKRITLAPTMRKYNRKNLMRDVIAGMIIMAVSTRFRWDMHRLPDCRQYTDCMARSFRLFCLQYFRRSAVYLRVDAAPAALIGSALLGMGIESGSKEAI